MNFFRKISVFLATLIVVGCLMSGCSTFRGWATDYIGIALQQNADEVIWIDDSPWRGGEIQAIVENNFAVDIANATIKLSVPPEVLIMGEGGGTATEGETIAARKSKTYHWNIRVPVQDEPQNIEYTVTVTSAITDAVTMTGLLYVEASTSDYFAFDMNTDAWQFPNYSETRSPLQQEDYDALVRGLTKREINTINYVLREEENNGYCYGMTVTSFLAKVGRLKASDIDSSATTLRSLKKTPRVKSVIAYYYLTQLTSAVMADKKQFEAYSTREQLQIIEEKGKAIASGSPPFVLGFYTQPNHQGGHAILAYGHKTGCFEIEGQYYNSCVLTYDCNYPDGNERAYLYYNQGTDQWCIPQYSKSSGFSRAISDINILDGKNMDTYKTVDIHVFENEQFNIYTLDGQWLGTIDEGKDVTGNSDRIWQARYDGMDDLLLVSIDVSSVADKKEGYIIKPTVAGETFDLSVSFPEQYYMHAVAEETESVVFDPSGTARINGQVHDWFLLVTDEHNFMWDTVSVKGTSGENIVLSATDEGYLLSGESLDGVTVYAENIDVANKTVLRTDETEVLITNENGKMHILHDADNNGTFESVLATGRPTERDTFLRSDTDWNIGYLIAAGVVLLSVVLAVVLRVLRTKKKKSQK